MKYLIFDVIRTSTLYKIQYSSRELRQIDLLSSAKVKVIGTPLNEILHGDEIWNSIANDTRFWGINGQQTLNVTIFGDRCLPKDEHSF